MCNGLPMTLQYTVEGFYASHLEAKIFLLTNSNLPNVRFLNVRHELLMVKVSLFALKSLNKSGVTSFGYI